MRSLILIATITTITSSASAQQCPPGMSGCWDSMYQRSRNDMMLRQYEQENRFHQEQMEQQRRFHTDQQMQQMMHRW